jgi:type IV pilus assembly protein PilO
MAKSNELVEKFSRAPLGTKIGVFAALAVLLGVGYWYLFYSDLEEQLRVGKAQAKKLSTDATKLKERQKQYRDLVDKKKDIEVAVTRNQVALPASSELPAFFVSLQSQAVAANVQVTTWDRGDESPVETYVKVPVKLTVRGDFYQIVEYFKLLYETRRIITVQDLNISSPTREGDKVVLTASFTASTFRQADAPPKKAEPAAAPADGAAPPEGDAKPAEGGKAAKPAAKGKEKSK